MLNKKMIPGLVLMVVFSFYTLSYSQNMDHKNHKHKSSYMSEINNEIKALSEEEINQLLNGHGMGLAKAAELNSYPDPMHVLEFSNELILTREQIEKTEALFHSVKTEAKKLGRMIVEKEKELDTLFKENRISQTLLRNKINEISELNSMLRFAHLNAHLLQKEILTNEQIKTYNELRGYN